MSLSNAARREAQLQIDELLRHGVLTLHEIATRVELALGVTELLELVAAAT